MRIADDTRIKLLDALGHLSRSLAALSQRAFCPTGQGGGVDPSCGSGGGGASEPAGSSTHPSGTETASVPATSKFSVGKHVKKIKGEEKECHELLSSLDAADKSFKGKLSKFLDKHPLEELNVGKMPPGASQSAGVYQSNKNKISIKSQKKYRPSLPGEAVDAEHAYKFIDDPNPVRDVQEGQKVVFLHELGHHVALTAIKTNAGGQKSVYADMIIKNAISDGKKVSEYANTSAHEYFAESFAAYHYAPKKLSPAAKKMVEDVLSKVL